MTTLQELQDMGADCAAAQVALASETTRLTNRLDVLPGGRSVERRTVESYIGHLGWLGEALAARQRLYAAEAAKVQGGGSSSVPTSQPTTPLAPPKVRPPTDTSPDWPWWKPGGKLILP